MTTRVTLGLVGLLVAIAVTGGHARQSDWVSLFDGKAIAHWRGFKQTTVPDGWPVVDGTLTRAGAGTDLVSREQYANFEFEFDWKVPRGGNSGVMYRVSEALDATYHTGPEYQILDDAVHADGKNPLTSAGSNYALHARSVAASNPVGEWNQGRLLVNGAHVEHWLNGIKVVDYELWTPAWTALVAASKFKEWPDYGKKTTGHIVLQDHGDRVQFRNLRVRRIQ
jgi:hypothetical protein